MRGDERCARGSKSQHCLVVNPRQHSKQTGKVAQLAQGDGERHQALHGRAPQAEPVVPENARSRPARDQAKLSRDGGHPRMLELRRLLLPLPLR